MPSEIVIRCAKAIAAKGFTIAFIESATAGRMCSEFALTDESGKILRGGISCYEVFIKENILKVPHEMIETCTPESAEVTEALARSGANLLTADITTAVTGLTTPGGSESEEKPVGTMFLDILISGKHIAHREVFSGNPESIILQTIDRAAEIILENL
jgi:nicotinamide-nucleotide amidase